MFLASLPALSASLPGHAASLAFSSLAIDWAVQGLGVPAGVGQVQLGVRRWLSCPEEGVRKWQELEQEEQKLE